MGKKVKKADAKTKINKKYLNVLEQLSDRHEATLKKLLHLQQQMEEQLQQLSERHDASIDKINSLERRVDEKLEQFSDRSAAAVNMSNTVEQQIAGQTTE